MNTDRRVGVDGPEVEMSRALVDAEGRVLALQEAWLEALVIRQSLGAAEKYMVNGHASAATQCLRDVALFADALAATLHSKLELFEKERNTAEIPR